MAKSSFEPGPYAHDIVQGDLNKTVGDYGVFAVDRVTGVARAIPNADAPCLSLGSYGSSAAEHNAAARDYLVRAGLPSDQLTFAQANAIVTGGGTSGDPASDKVSSSVYVTTFQRMLKGIEVIDSIAWVRLDSAGKSAGETVYWPAIPQSVLDDANAFETRLEDPTQDAAYRAKLPAGLPTGHVVIRHAGADYHGPFYAKVSYDVSGAYTRHFDANGKEFRLPDELTGAGVGTK